MPALANISINDGAASPVAHVFAPVTTDGVLASLKERVGTTPELFPALSVSVREPLKGQTEKVYRLNLRITQPTSKTVDGVAVVDFTNSVSVEFLISARSTLQSRKDILAFAKNMLSHATITSVVQDLEPLF